MSRFDLIVLLVFSVFGLQPGSFPAGLLQNSLKAASIAMSWPQHWQTSARLHRGLKRTSSGTLSIGPEGVAFAGRGAPALRWSFPEIQSIDVSAHALVLTSYENRPHHEPGDRRYRFELQSEISPQLAEEIAQRLGKPTRNADPDPRATWFAAIPAKHQKPFGGSNGELRFSAAGVDFITPVSGDARVWRWADIQTIANPDPYHFRVAGYLETYEFELKQPMSSQLFDQLWDSVYARGLNLPYDATEAIHDR